MNTLRFLSLALLFALSLGACREEYPADCAGYSAAIYKRGCAYAEGSYEDFGDYALFVREREADTLNGGWKHDEREKSIQLSSINEFCAEQMRMGMRNLMISDQDTIYLKFSNLGTSDSFPTAYLAYLDADAVLESYHLLDHDKNWLLIEEVNADSTLVSGRFQISFVTAIEQYLNGERERWDDPNRQIGRAKV